MLYFHTWVGYDTLCRTSVFASYSIFGSCSVFQCIRGVKRQRTIFHAHVRPVWIPQNACQDTLYQNCVFHPLGSTGHVVRYGALGAQNIDALFFMFGWPIKSHKHCWDTLPWTSIFASGGICGSHSVFCCVRGEKCQCTIFMPRCARCWWHKQRIGTRYACDTPSVVVVFTMLLQYLTM
jgi:hypothetical protein